MAKAKTKSKATQKPCRHCQVPKREGHWLDKHEEACKENPANKEGSVGSNVVIGTVEGTVVTTETAEVKQPLPGRPRVSKVKAIVIKDVPPFQEAAAMRLLHTLQQCGFRVPSISGSLRGQTIRVEIPKWLKIL